MEEKNFSGNVRKSIEAHKLPPATKHAAVIFQKLDRSCSVEPAFLRALQCVLPNEMLGSVVRCRTHRRGTEGRINFPVSVNKKVQVKQLENQTCALLFAAKDLLARMGYQHI